MAVTLLYLIFRQMTDTILLLAPRGCLKVGPGV
jgi:hypothetical protein